MSATATVGVRYMIDDVADAFRSRFGVAVSEKAAAQAIPGVETVEVTFHTRVRPSGSGKADADPIAGVRNTIAVAYWYGFDELHLAVVPMLGLFASFRDVQQIYTFIGAYIFPTLALVLIVFNSRGA